MNFQDYDRDCVIKKFDTVLARGLCIGVGTRDGQMCIEAAICYALDLPHGDNPECVDPAVRRFKIALNDASGWRSPQSRAQHLRALGIAQIGSRGVIDSRAFAARIAEKTIQVLIPALFRDMWPNFLTDLVDACESTGTEKAARALARAADTAAYAAADTGADAAAEAAAYAAAYAAELKWQADQVRKLIPCPFK